ncbi:MAG TPA: YidB family protein [Phenylobacterium sp.]|jgi:uncharacterized protein YidB (DUF937 family)
MGILDGLMKAAGGGAGPLDAITQMLGAHDDGLNGLLKSFEAEGLGAVAQSWVSKGANLPVSAEQIQAVLSNSTVAAFAQKLGVDPQTAAGHLAQLLPQVVDHLTPNGEVPTGALGALEGLLDKFK